MNSLPSPSFAHRWTLLLPLAALAALGACRTGTARSGAKSGPDEAARAERARLEAVVAKKPGDVAARFDLAKHLHWMGVDGDESAAARSVELLDKLQTEEPNDPRILAYRGAALVLEAKRVVYWRKGELANEGLRALDRAVEMAPDTWETRYVRATATRDLPEFFNRRVQTSSDLAFAAARTGSAARADTMARASAEERRVAAANYAKPAAREPRVEAEGGAESAETRVSTGR